MKRASSGGGRGRRAFGNEKGMKGTKGGHDWLKGVEDAWGWRGRAVETVARGTSDAHFCDFFGGRKEGEILWGNCKCFFFLFNFKGDWSQFFFRSKIKLLMILEVKRNT